MNYVMNYDSPFEMLMVKIFNTTSTFLFCCVYIPPNTPADKYVEFYKSINSYDISRSNLILVEDFNISCMHNEHNKNPDNCNDNKIMKLNNF